MKLIKAKLEQIAENLKSTKKQYSKLAIELVKKTTLVMKRADGNKEIVSNEFSDRNDGEVTIDFYKESRHNHKYCSRLPSFKHASLIGFFYPLFDTLF